MAIFNPEFFTNPAASLNSSFGIPTCILNFAGDALALLSSKSLISLSNAADQGKEGAFNSISEAVKKLYNATGFLEVDSAGNVVLKSEASEDGLDLSFLDTLDAINRDLALAEDLVLQGVDYVNDVLNCLSDFSLWLGSTRGDSKTSSPGGLASGGSSGYVQNSSNADRVLTVQVVTEATEFIQKCNELQARIATVLSDRQTLIQREADDEAPIFRLVYGPPVSKQGLFILSEDGLYYDSQDRMYNGKDLPDTSDIGVVIPSESWKMNYPANLGGKGTIVSLSDINQYVDTLFDINKIDESKELKEYYDNDHFLQVIEAQKQKQVLDTSAQITELYASGYSNDSALLVNYRQSLYGILGSYDDKLNKRKKQIEVAVKASTEFGVSSNFAVGEIPINDFSYLSSVNLSVSLEQQQRLAFEAGDVEEVVLPIKPIFVRSFGSESNRFVLPFSVAEVGKGAIVTTGSVSSTTIPTLSITDSIVTDKLFAAYNFLKAAGTPPDSEKFASLNCASLGISDNAQLIGRNSTLFTSGLGIPFLAGMVKFNNFAQEVRDYRSVCRLPDTTDFQNFMYNKNGGSFECWLHMPGYGTSSNLYERGERTTLNLNAETAEWVDYNYYKIILGNENVGGSLAANVSSVVTAEGTDSVRGMLMGFSRDPAITFDEKVFGGSDTEIGLDAGIEASATTASSCFFIAPTMSVNKNQATFVPQIDSCSGDSYAKLALYDTVTVNGVKFADVANEFMHLAVSFDVSSDKCRVYLDSNLMTTSSLSKVFGTAKSQIPRLPTFIQPETSEVSSFYYADTTVRQRQGVSFFDNGPRNNPFFTPWLLGGGWTDGIPVAADTSAGGFMGTGHGYSSGLNGYVGSVKFYAKPLSNSEVKTNYNAQKGFFKNIVT